MLQPRQHGIRYTVFESEASAHEHRPREWGITIHWALPLLRELLPEALIDRLQSACVDPSYICPDGGVGMPIYNGATGELVKVQFTQMARVVG